MARSSQAQEVLDTTTPLDIPIQEGVGPSIPESSLSYKGDLSVFDRDQLRLDITSMQTMSFETSGEFIQVKDARALSGDSITFEAVVGAEVDSYQEVHVYEAPCGKGWQLIITDPGQYVESIQFDNEGKQFKAFVPIQRSYGYGCEHASRTFNW